MGEPDSAKTRLGVELSKLREARPDVTYKALIRQASSRGVKLSESSLSDWFRGRSVPSDCKSFALLVQLLTGDRPSGQLVHLYEMAGRESVDRLGTRRPPYLGLGTAITPLSATVHRLPSLDMIHYANVDRLNVLLAARGHPARLQGIPAHCDRTMMSLMAVMESISQRLAQVELPLKRLTPDLNLRTLQEGDLLVFDRKVNTLNGPQPGEIRALTGDLDIDPLVYIKKGGVRIVMPYDPKYVTTSTAYSDFIAGQTQMFGLCKIKRRGRPKDAPHRAKKPKAQFIASPLVLGQISGLRRHPELSRSGVRKGFEVETDSYVWYGPWTGSPEQTQAS